MPIAPLVSYINGEPVPLPEVLEKNTDSIWALWSDLVAPTSDQATILMGLMD